MFFRILFCSILLLLALPSEAGRPRDECPRVWVVSYENSNAKSAGQVEIAEGFDTGEACQVDHTSVDGAYAKASIEGNTLTFDVSISPPAFCSRENPCTVVVGSKISSCGGSIPSVSRVDGVMSTEVKVRRVVDTGKEECETQTLVIGYLYGSTPEGGERLFQGKVELGSNFPIPDRPVVQ